VFFQHWRSLDPKDKPGMRAVANSIQSTAHPADKIYIGSNFVFFSFRYYNQTGIQPRLISKDPKDLALLNPEDLISNDTIFNHPEVKKNDIVWLVWTTAFGLSKPNVPGSWQKMDEKEFGDTPEFKGNIIVTQYRIN
jgi:hypothetical protein